ncbi:MAG: hypothetical protein AAB325_01675 [Pseudomonadota bacterium]
MGKLPVCNARRGVLRQGTLQSFGELVNFNPYARVVVSAMAIADPDAQY